MGFAEIKADTRINRQRVAAIDFSKMDRNALAKFVKDEFVENVWPFLEAMAEATQGEVKSLEEAVGELDEAVEVLEEGDDEDALHPETAQQILGVLQLGRQIAIDIAPVLKSGGKLDEIKRKKLVKMVTAFRQAVEVVAEIVVAITVKPDDDAPADGEAANDEEPGDGEIEDDAAAVDGDDDEGGEGEADDGFDDASGGEGG